MHRGAKAPPGRTAQRANFQLIKSMIRKNYKQVLFLDFETRSELDVQDVGSHRYARHASTEMTLISWAFNDETACTSREMPEEVYKAIEDCDTLKVAHNAEFDAAIAIHVLGIDTRLCDWYDTAYVAAYYGLPRKLGFLANVLKTQAKASPEQMLHYAKPVKKTAPADSMDLFGVPTDTEYNEMKERFSESFEKSVCVGRYNEDVRDVETAEHLRVCLEYVQGLRNSPMVKSVMQYGQELIEIERTLLFKLYAVSDVEVMRQAYNIMSPLPSIECFVMQFTFYMNFDGVPFDMDLATQIETLAHKYATDAGEEARRLYGVKNLRSTKQVQAALASCGVELSSLNKKAREGIEHPILVLRDQATGAAFSKIKTARERICPDSRLHGEFVGHGAHTGRWSSRGGQLQNFAHGGDDTSTDLSKVQSYDHLRKHLRLCIYGAGKDFVCADLSQIEARVTAWLAQCKWRMDAFANKEDIYSRSAERMFNIPEVHKGMPERQMGKCAELGLGFGGGPNAIDRVAPDFFRTVGLEKVTEIVRKWRGANPEICDLWRRLERAFRESLRSSVCRVTVVDSVRLVFKYDGRTASITLPSGRALYYKGVHMDERHDLYYLDYSRGGEHAVRTKIWGGVLTENIVQAIARDILVDIMRRVQNAYCTYKCVGTVHDEVWYLVDDGVEAYANLIQEMERPIEWAPGLVTTGDGFYSDRYIK